MEKYPKPDFEGWEEEYRYAFSSDEAYSSLLRSVSQWSKEAEEITESEANPFKKQIV